MMGHERIIIDCQKLSHEQAIEVARAVRVVAIDRGAVVTKCKVIHHPDEDDERHTLVSRT